MRYSRYLIYALGRCVWLFLSLLTLSFSQNVPLNVPFVPQVPPGSWKETNNCGQTAALMTIAFYGATTPTEDDIKKIDNFLFDRFGDPTNDYNGSPTGLSKIVTINKDYGGFAQAVGYSGWTLEDIRRELNFQNPVIVAVWTNMIVDPKRQRKHFMVMTGMDGANVYVNDPGHTHGKGMSYALSDFQKAWDSLGNVAVLALKKPELRISTDTGCLSQAQCAAGQGSTFVFDGSGFSKNAPVTRTVSFEGSEIKSENIAATSAGNLINWSFPSSCSTPIGTYVVGTTDQVTGNSTSVTETITSGNCPVLGPAISVTPSSPFNFGPITVGASGAQVFTITNEGNAPLVVKSIIFNPSDFSKTIQTPFVVPDSQNSSVPFDVTFTPSAAGLRVGTMTLNSNDPKLPSLTIALSGTGLSQVPPPDLTITKTVSLNPAISGGTVTYVLATANSAGTSDAANVRITDPLDSRLTHISCVTSSGGTCSTAGNLVTAVFPTLGTGASATVNISATLPVVTTQTQIANVATVAADNEPPGNAGNNSASIALSVIPSVGGGPSGGFVKAIAIVPNAPDVVYVGHVGELENLFLSLDAGQGVFKSVDGGQSWIPANNGLTDAQISSIAVAPTGPLIAYAGDRGGIIKTTDGGQTWISVNNGLPGSWVSSLAVDPRDSSIAYACAEPGIFKSNDGGQSWSQSNAPFTGVFDCYALVFDPAVSTTLYAGSSFGVLKSTDAGASWLWMDPTLSMPISGLAIDPKNTSTVYVAGQTPTGPSGVFKSTDGGHSWNNISSTLPSFVGAIIAGLVIDPINSNTVYVGVDLAPWTVGNNFVFKTLDGGQSWTTIRVNATTHPIFSLVGDPVRSNILLLTAQGDGVLRSVNGGQTWVRSNSGLTTRAVYALAIPRDNSNQIYAGTSSGMLFRSADGGGTWSVLTPESSGAVLGADWTQLFNTILIDPVVPSTLYAGGAVPALKSTDGGETWSILSSGTTSPVAMFTGAIDPKNPSTLYGGDIGFLWKTTDGGRTWTHLALPTTSGAMAIAIDPTTTTTMYVGDTWGQLFKSTDGGVSWTPHAVGVGPLVAIAIDPTNPLTIYAASFGYAYYGQLLGGGIVQKSTDGGMTWSTVLQAQKDSSGNNVPVRCIAIDPVLSNTLYVGTFGNGVLKSINGGSTWATSNTGLPTLRINRIVIDSGNASTLYVATFGAGVFKSVDAGQTWQPTGAN